MKYTSIFICFSLFSMGLVFNVSAGPYPPAAGKAGSTAIHMDDEACIAWATGWIDPVTYGADVDEKWKTPQNALGKAGGNAYDIITLGRNGAIVLIFDDPMMNGDGWDFAIFENAYSDTFLELAFVEVSSDGENFLRFNNDSLNPAPVGGFGNLDPTNIDGFAGKYRQGYGTPFDLQTLADKKKVVDGTVNLSRITHIKIIDIAGDGTYTDTSGDVIYDPYPTKGSAGFDLDAVGVRYINTSENNLAPDQPSLLSPANGASDLFLNPTLKTFPFSDPDEGNLHLRTEWRINDQNDFSNGSQLVFEKKSSGSGSLTELTLPRLILDEGTTYWWRVKFYDGENSGSPWSEAFSFTTKIVGADISPKNGIPDNKEVSVDWDGDGNTDTDIPSVAASSSSGNEVWVGVKAGENTVSIEAVEPIDPNDTDTNNRPEQLPSGLIGFKVKVGDPGRSAFVSIHLSEPAPIGAEWWKYDPISGWRTYPHAVFSADRASVELELKDGDTSFGDADGFKNGIIVDPGGVGVSTIFSPPPDGEAGFGGSSGCFIATATSASSGHARVIVLPPLRNAYLIIFSVAGILLASQGLTRIVKRRGADPGSLVAANGLNKR